MEAQSGMVVAVAILDADVVTDLPTDAVAMVVPRDDLADRHVRTILEPDASGIVAVEQIVPGLVAVDGEVLDDDAR